MKKIIKTTIAALAISFSTAAVAGVLMEEWTEGTTRYCKYSDGSVISVSFGSTCPRTN